jgi:hypothetical protein
MVSRQGGQKISTVELIALLADREWLDEATKTIALSRSGKMRGGMVLRWSSRRIQTEKRLLSIGSHLFDAARVSP